MSDYLELTKPRITLLILVCTAVGFLFGVRDSFSGIVFAHTLLGTALLASGTAALNQWYERDADALMRRTRNRPIPAGRILANRAFLFGVALAIAGFSDLLIWVNTPAAVLGLATLISYLFLYTPLKKISPHSTSVGAIPGAMPPLIGYAAACGRIDPPALVLCAILFIWQFPHFYAIAWMYRDDYARAGIRMLPVVYPDGRATAKQILLFSLILIPVSLLPGAFAMAGGWYVAGAVILGGIFLWSAIRVTRDRTALNARRVLLNSVMYLPLLFVLLILDSPVWTWR